MLMREIKRIPAVARMVLTHKPLQENLAQLWAVLNFVLAELFGDLSTFQSSLVFFFSVLQCAHRGW